MASLVGVSKTSQSLLHITGVPVAYQFEVDELDVAKIAAIFVERNEYRVKVLGKF